ncbi:MAG TPA: aldo/keto reductase [Dehalococcoidia bacterium]|nr:aldo/keto reductase [Dehalococcoidia bacterium]
MTGLPRRTLGRTGLDVTELGFGAMELATNSVSDHDADRLLNAVLDAGINFIDTSIDYGRSEERIGRFIAHRRSEYFLASKCGCVPGSFEHYHDERPQNVRAGVEHSLRLLGTDCLDLVQIHRSLSQLELEASGVLDALSDLKSEGKVRFIGISGVLPALIEQIQMGLFDVFQIPYSLLQREHEALIYLASGLGAGIVIRGGVARGMPADWTGHTYYMLPGSQARDRWEAARLDELLDGMSRQEFALRFTLSNTDLDTTIVGTRSVDHLRENMAAALKGPLPADMVTEVKRRMTGRGA